MVTAFVIGSLAAAAIGLPVDHLRRRVTGAASTVAGLVGAAALVAVVAGLAGAHVLGGGLAVPALVLGLVAGNVAADAFATRRWGPARTEA
jgi:predicted membrane-bound spermidine synthase